MNKEEQKYAKQTDIPEDMWEAVGALRESLFDNPCVILDAEVCEDKDRHYFFSDPDLYAAIQKVVEALPGQSINGKSYIALAYALQKHGVVCEAAITDSTDYDGGKTLRGILRAFDDLYPEQNALEPLAWRKSAPDKPGWWWRRRNGATTCVLVQPDECYPEAWSCGSLWAGPFTPPPLTCQNDSLPNA